MIEAAFIGTFVPLVLLVAILRHSRPMMLSFLWGTVAFLITFLVMPSVSAWAGKTDDLQFGAVFLGPPVEETLKALPLFAFLFWGKPSFVPFIYIFGVASGIGFAIEENLLYLIATQSQAPGESGIPLMILRSFSTCLMHAITCAMVGYAVTLFRRHRRAWILAPAVALLLAITLHALFNQSVFLEWKVVYLVAPFVIFVFGAILMKEWEKRAPETENTVWK